MLDGDLGVAGMRPSGTAPSRRYCDVGRDAARGVDNSDPARLDRWYQCRGLSTRAIGEITALDRRRVTRILRQAGVPLRPRGAGRLRPLRRDLGIPVRAGGIVPEPGPEEIKLVEALYADPLIAAVLDARDMPRVPPGGPIWQRFADPVQLTPPLVKDLCWGCGAALAHIELLAGQPAMTVRGFMRWAGIPLRRPGGRTPFLRRWRAGLKATQKPSRASPHHPRTAPAIRTVAAPAAVAGQG